MTVVGCGDRANGRGDEAQSMGIDTDFGRTVLNKFPARVNLGGERLIDVATLAQVIEPKTKTQQKGVCV